jgi:hypothetical protein
VVEERGTIVFSETSKSLKSAHLAQLTELVKLGSQARLVGVSDLPFNGMDGFLSLIA